MISIPLDNILDVAYTKPGIGDYSHDVESEDETLLHPPADPSYGGNDAAYARPPTGGRFGDFGAPEDGGAADMEEDATVTPPLPPVLKPAYALTGRSGNQASRLNLYPWFKVPREGLDMNNPTVVTVTSEVRHEEEAADLEPEEAAGKAKPKHKGKK